MKTKRLVLFALLPALLTSCKQSTETTISVDDLYVPTFSSDKKITMGAWSWTTRNVNDTQLSDLKEAGISLLIGTFNNNSDTADGALLDRAKEYGVDLIIDKRPWSGEIPSYANKENFLGYCVYDEPYMSHLNTLKTMKENWDESDLKDKMFFVNLNPSYSSQIGTTYEEYVRAYTEDCGLGMVAFDYYAQYHDLETDEPTLREDWLFNFGIASHYARKNNVPLWFTLLTTEHNSSTLHYINPTARDLEYQMYVGMAFGTKYMIHYTYAATGADHLNPIIDKNGNPTDSYYDAKEATETIRKWDGVYMNFESLGVTGIFGTKENTGLLDYLVHYVPVDEYQTLVSAKSDYDVVLGHFADENNNKGFVITNMTNPYESKNANVKLKFNSNYKGVKIYSAEKEEVKVLTNNSVDINVKSGSGVFVVPLKIK